MLCQIIEVINIDSYPYVRSGRRTNSDVSRTGRKKKMSMKRKRIIAQRFGKMLLFIFITVGFIRFAVNAISGSSGNNDTNDTSDNRSVISRVFNWEQNTSVNESKTVVKKFINTEDDKYLILINNENQLNKDYIPDNLTDISKRVSSSKSEMLLDSKAASQYELMIAKMKEDGLHHLTAVSGYRPYDYQSGLFEKKVQQYTNSMDRFAAENEASKLVARPGASEHQVGLAIDVSIPSLGYDLYESFSNTQEYKWLTEHASEYGFIIRYMRDKSDITKIAYEPWHLRYVGRSAAEIISAEGICLEEFVMEYLGSVTN